MSKKNSISALPKLTIIVACSLVATGCAVDPKTGQPSFKETFNSDDPCSSNARNIGIVAGSIVGAVIGHQLDRNAGKFVGAGLGGLVGGLIGNDMDRQRCELAKVAKQYQLEMTFSAVNADGSVNGNGELRGKSDDSTRKNAIGTVLSIQDKSEEGGHFFPSSEKLTPRAQQYFAAIAQSYNTTQLAEGSKDKEAKQEYLRYGAQRKILLVGHTDDTGPTQFNADLSERRAKAVGKFLTEHGIPKESIYFQGAGESYPIADNNTEAGRMQNRRVEIVALADDANFRKYLEARKPKYEYYRAVEPGTVQAALLPLNSKAEKLPHIAAKTKASSNKSSHENARAKSGSVAAGKNQSPTLTAVEKKKNTISALSNSNIDFGGMPLSQAVAVASIGKVEQKKPWFSLVSPAYANEPAVLRDCMQDRPRSAGAVKALDNGKSFDTNEYMPGLYGKTWTDKVNGHQIVLNKISVLRNEAAVTQLPEFKVYANYNPSKNRNVLPNVSERPQVNTYKGTNGVLYRMFLDGRAGLSCVDVLFDSEAVAAAKAGKVLYTHGGQTYVAEFKPAIYK